MQKHLRNTDPVERLVHLVDLLIRLKLREMKAGRSQKEMILLLGDAGITGGEIASLLRIDRTTVAPILSRARGTPRTKQKKSRGPLKKG